MLCGGATRLCASMTMAEKRAGSAEAMAVRRKGPEKETIHSGHFMVSDFEAEAQDDGDELAVPLPEEEVVVKPVQVRATVPPPPPQQLSIETSLTKLFQCMSLAYRQKLTSPKWNRFKGIRLRWKDKIRLNNVIWRCWHMQFIGKKNALVCQFASPLDVDTHNKPEAVVLEGKYWKRKLSAVTAEYKKWRMYYRNQALGCLPRDVLSELDSVDWQITKPETMVEDVDYMEFMSDTLFSTITNQPFAFPDTREIARGAGIADFIQPSLVQLQPNLDDFMDTLEPLQDLLQARLAPVPEEGVGVSAESLSYQPIVDGKSGILQQPQQVSFSPYMTTGTWFVSSYTPPNTPENSIPPTSYQPTPPPPPPIHAPKTPPILPVNNLTPAETKKSSRRDDVFAVPKIKPKPRSQSNPCAVLPRKEVTSTPTLISAVSESSLQSTQTNTALLHQLLTNSNTSFSFIGDQAGAVGPVLMTNRVDPTYGRNIYGTIDSSIIYQAQSDVSKTESQFALPSDIKRTPALVSQPTPHSTNTGTLLISPSQSPVPFAFVSVSNAGPDSPASDQLSYSPQSVASPPSSTSPSASKCVQGYKEHKRVCHINAEQKRRCNIKNGFDTLHSLIPQLKQNPNAKMSKAAMLQKGADYIRQLRNERNHLKQEIDSLRQQIDTLNSSISNCQAMLPATGAPVSKQRNTKMRDMFQQYVRQRTHDDWKFWILSLICEPLLLSFSTNVSTTTLDELYHSTLQWVEQHCSLSDLRPIVLNSLRYLCRSTEVLTDPTRLPMEARSAVDKPPKKHS